MSEIKRKKHTGEPGNPGQFGSKPNTESAVGLLGADGLCSVCDQVASESDGMCQAHTEVWGDAGIRVGQRTIFGEVQEFDTIAPGIAVFSTAGHGGVQLSPERNREVPSALRKKGGLYEEDCEAHIPHYVFADEYTASRHYPGVTDADEFRASAADGLIEWYPDQWEKLTGETIPVGVSTTKDERLWHEANAENMVTRSAQQAQTPGFVLVTAKRASTDETAEYLVPKDEYTMTAQPEHRLAGISGVGSFVIDESRHARLPDQPPADKSGWVFEMPDWRADTSLTESARKRIAKDLNRRWRGEDGRVQSLGQIITSDGLSGRAIMVEDGVRKYRLTQRAEHGSFYSYPVYKATYQMFDGALPGQSDRDAAHTDYQIARHKADAEMARGGSNFAELARRRKELTADVDAKYDRWKSFVSDDNEEWKAEQAAREARGLAREQAAEVHG